MSDDRCTLSDFDLTSAGTALRGRSAVPSSHAWARLLIVHGYGEHCGRYIHFMQWLAERGVACDAIDLRGHGRSGGRRAFVRRWDEYLDDLRTFLARGTSSNGHPVPTFLMGHSHGGLITAAAGERGLLSSSTITGCIIASPYLATRVRIPGYKRFLAHAVNPILPWLGVPKGVKPQWLTSDPAMRAADLIDPLINRIATPRWYLTMRTEQRCVIADAGAFKLPMLCLAGDADVIADPSATAAFFQKAESADKSLYVYENRAHELIREIGREAVFADILGWMRARVPLVM